MSALITTIEKQDVVQAVERAYAGRPQTDDANLLRAVASWVEGLIQYGESGFTCLKNDNEPPS